MTEHLTKQAPLDSAGRELPCLAIGDLPAPFNQIEAIHHWLFAREGLLAINRAGQVAIVCTKVDSDGQESSEKESANAKAKAVEDILIDLFSEKVGIVKDPAVLTSLLRAISSRVEEACAKYVKATMNDKIEEVPPGNEVAGEMTPPPESRRFRRTLL
jgi:hypothetical protein